jgi:PadR family transcriptional regulator PadR
MLASGLQGDPGGATATNRPDATGRGDARPWSTIGALLLPSHRETLDQLGPLHGYGIARRIEQVGKDAVIVNQGTIYLCLVRLVQKKWIKAKWGTSDNNRKAKFYSITRAGQTQLIEETDNWERISGVIGRVLQPDAQR